jgi:hypothetical protein
MGFASPPDEIFELPLPKGANESFARPRETRRAHPDVSEDAIIL